MTQIFKYSVLAFQDDSAKISSSLESHHCRLEALRTRYAQVSPHQLGLWRSADIVTGSCETWKAMKAVWCKRRSLDVSIRTFHDFPYLSPSLPSMAAWRSERTCDLAPHPQVSRTFELSMWPGDLGRGTTGLGGSG